MNGEIKEKNNHTLSPNQKEEEKLEFFKREEIRTMEKDLFKLREEEAKREREKISGLKIEEKKKKEEPIEKVPQPVKPARKFLPAVFAQPVFSKLSPSEKIFIRVVSIIIIILLLFFIFTFWYWYSTEMKKISYSPLPTPTPIEKTTPSPEITPTLMPTPSPTPTFSITDNILNVGYKIPSSPRLIDTIIVHSTYNTNSEDVYNIEEVIKSFKAHKVTTHYIITRDGAIYRLAPDKSIAYHAGTSKMPDGRTNVNNFSIGIELIYTKEDSPNEIQYQALSYLVKNLRQQYTIPLENILGTKDINTKKDDPWNFDWSYFRSLLQ